MAENLTIGRTPVYGPYDLRETGPTVSFGFDVSDVGVSATETRARMEQLRGLKVGDIVPVLWNQDDRYDGFYRVADVRLDPSATYLETGYVSGSATLTRVGRSNSLIRVDMNVLIVARDTSTYAVSTSNPRAAIPVDGIAPSKFGNHEVVVEGGKELRFYGSTAEFVRYMMPPEDYYATACGVELLWEDGVWRKVVGLELPGWATPDRVRLSNNRIRWRFTTGTSTTPSALYVQQVDSDGESWGDEDLVASSIGFDGSSSDTLTAQSPRIIVNTPAALVVEYPDATDENETVTVRQQRGELFITITSTGNTGMRVTFADSVSTTGTGRAVFGDYVFACESTFTASGQVASSVGGSASRSIMIGKPAAAPEDEEDLTEHWWCGVSVRDVLG